VKKKRFSNEEISVQQLELPIFSNKRFSINKMVNAKLDALARIITELSHSEIVWLSRIEDFFLKTDYLTERQCDLVDSILKSHNLTTSES
jgi:hypothetical protein